MSATPHYFIGLMAGTSLDGIDCALVDLSTAIPRVVASSCTPYDASLRASLLGLCGDPQVALCELGRLDIEVGRAFAATVIALLKNENIDAAAVTALGSHGQTVFHEPNTAAPFSLQIGDPNTLAELTGITTIGDFRRRDMAAGGQGAPIAPLLHRHCFSSKDQNRLIINVGGIANLTSLPTNEQTLAFDTGPGNVLMDYWVAKHHGKPYDAAGEWARTGAVNQTLLAILRATPYFALNAPKSTGRELFNGTWLEGHLQQLGEPLPAQDVQATLLELTATTVVDAATARAQSGALYLCGGGAHNDALRYRIAELAPQFSVGTTAELGLDPDWVEAAAFAWMAQQTLAGNTVDTAPFTGARKPVILGGIYRS